MTGRGKSRILTESIKVGTGKTAEADVSAYAGYMLVFIIGVFTVFVYLLNEDEEKLLLLGLNGSLTERAVSARGNGMTHAVTVRDGFNEGVIDAWMKPDAVARSGNSGESGIPKRHKGGTFVIEVSDDYSETGDGTVISGIRLGAADRIRLYAAFLSRRFSRHGYLFTVFFVLTAYAVADACLRRRINLLRGVTVTPLKNGLWKRLPALTAFAGIMSFLYVCSDSLAFDAWLGFIVIVWWKTLRECVVNLPQVAGVMDCR